MQLHCCSIGRRQFPVGRCWSGPINQRLNRPGQRPRFKSYQTKPAALGEEQGDNVPQRDASEVDDTLSYLAKLFTVSVLGGAVIKYGSLIISLPFHPDGLIALSMIAFPPACFAAWMLTQPGKQS
ncbi:hypothetical protein M9435_003525 [Picochlorum sp. BPE23]|nr:hypothetical protein M9435_003525 [Picochlorum sp. BPE23]